MQHTVDTVPGQGDQTKAPSKRGRLGVMAEVALASSSSASRSHATCGKRSHHDAPRARAVAPPLARGTGDRTQRSAKSRSGRRPGTARCQGRGRTWQGRTPTRAETRRPPPLSPRRQQALHAAAGVHVSLDAVVGSALRQRLPARHLRTRERKLRVATHDTEGELKAHVSFERRLGDAARGRAHARHPRVRAHVR